ncbi:hypothetical protein KR026_004617 [Drosophila bipectinata]|nr:hypothetical protein KR026_004617 [Drosophila bipectinata]
MVILEAIYKLIDCAGETMKNLHQHKTWDTFIPSLFKKAPEFGACVMELSTKIQVCLTDEEKRQSEINFSRVGDQIAHFVANQGPQCLAVKMDSIIKCGNMPYKVGQISPTCVDLEQIESCVLHLLESCSDNTPVKVVQSIFKVVKNETNCHSGNKPSQGGIPVAAWVGIGLLIGIVVIVGVYLSYSKLVK